MPNMLTIFTGALRDMGFTPDISGDGIQHGWRRDLAQMDVLLPDGIGERAAHRPGAGGAPTISSPGTTQALNRSGPVEGIWWERSSVRLQHLPRLPPNRLERAALSS